MKWQTVVPLFHLPLIDGPTVRFAGGLAFDRLPGWLLNDRYAQRISATEFELVKAANHAFVVEYDASSLGDPDEAWKGAQARSKQEINYELATLANLSLWLAKPSPTCFSQVFHGPEMGGNWIVQQSKQYSRMLWQSNEGGNELNRNDVEKASRLHAEFVKVTRDNSVWTAIRSTWSGLTLSSEIRYLLFWIALEALFGPEDAREMTFRLSQRIGFFLGEGGCGAKPLFATAKKCYALRSKVAHGRWKGDAADAQLMAATKDILRRAFLRLLEDASLMARFTGAGANRENYLDEIVFGNESASSGQ